MSGRYTNDYHNVKNRYLAAGPTRNILQSQIDVMSGHRTSDYTKTKCRYWPRGLPAKDVINYGRYE